MKIVFIEPGAPGFHVFSGIRLPRLGLPLLSALAHERGHEASVFCEDLAPLDETVIDDADIVGISATTSTAPRAYLLADRFMSQGKFVVLGGPHPTFRPDEALEHAHAVVRGEGEETFVELLDALKTDRSFATIQGLSYRRSPRGAFTHNPDRPCHASLDDLPAPDLASIRGFARMRVTPIMTSRGCPHNCRFCSVTRMFGRRYRTRSVEKVLDDLARLKPRFVFFYDDNFAADVERVRELCRGIVASGLSFRWSAQVRLDLSRHPDVLALMKEAGCTLVHIGIESIDPASLDALGKKQRIADPMRALAVFKEHGIDVHGMFIFGTDADTVDSLRETAAFSRKAPLFTVQYLAMTPLPGTPLFDELERGGRLLTSDWSQYDGHHVVHRPARMTPLELQREIIAATVRFYSSWRVLARALTFRWMHAYYLMSGHRKMKRWLKSNRDLVARVARGSSRAAAPLSR